MQTSQIRLQNLLQTEAKLILPPLISSDSNHSTPLMNAICPFVKSPYTVSEFLHLQLLKVCVRYFFLVRYWIHLGLGRAKILATALFHLDTSWPAALIMKSLFYIF